MRIAFLVAVTTVVIAAAAFADTIHMKDGRKLEGEIVGETETAVHLKMKYGTMKIDRGDIERIEKAGPGEEKKSEPEPEPKPKPKPKPKQESSWEKEKRAREEKEKEERIKQALKELGDDSAYRRREAVQTLGGYRVKRAVGSLIRMLKDDKDVSVRAAAARALGLIGEGKSVKALAGALQDEDKKVRETAAESLGRIGGDEAIGILGETLKREDEEIRKAVTEALGGTRDKKALKYLVTALKDTDIYVRLAAVKSMGDLRCEEAIEHLEGALKDKHDFFRSQVPTALGRIGGKKAAEALLRALQTDDSEIEQNTIKALGNFQEREVIDKLATLFKAHPDKGKYLAALMAIGKPAVAELLMALETPDAGIRNSIAATIWRIRDDRVLVPLIRMALTDPNRQVQYTAQRGLELMRLREWLAPLTEALKDADERIRDFALRQLKGLTERDFGADYDKWKAWYEKNKERWELRPHLRRLPARIEALKHRDEKVREHAIGELKELTKQDFGADYDKWRAWYEKENMASLLASEKGRKQLLQKTGADAVQAVPALTRLLQDDNSEIRAAALDTLRQITGQDFGTNREKWKEWYEKNKDK